MNKIQFRHIQVGVEKVIHQKKQSNLATLIQKMTENGKNELLPKLSDLDFLKKLYPKYQIQ